MLEKTYDFQKIESKITCVWEQANAFSAGVNSEPDAEPFTIVIPPPNVTGSLHIGHALNNTLQDILVRFERMRGKNVLWQPGMDHAGIATQMVVERKLAERGTRRQDMTRDEFLDHVWRWKNQSGGVILDQLKRLGASCDWSRERFTMDEGLSQAVIKVFVTLYKQGLIYRDKRLVNWDPVLLTAISDLEVDQKETDGTMWFFRYPIEGCSFNPEDSNSFIPIATTRPETFFGDTGVAVHSEDIRYQKFIGKNVLLPLLGRKIPVVADVSADPEKGTGAVKITPAHDFNDFETGKRCSLRSINIFSGEAQISILDNEDFQEGLEKTSQLDEIVQEFHGLDRFAARKNVVSYMKNNGFLIKEEYHKHTVPHGDRSGVPIEPRLTDQWYVNVKELAGPAICSVRDGHIRFVPENWEKIYFDWMENIQPWCVSRQLWWGHRIPVWYGPDGHAFVETTEEEALSAAIQHYLSHEGPWKAWVEDRLENAFPGEIIRRDEDVLDTWFSSALWPFSTMGWPQDTVDMAIRYPTSVLVTGFDIIFFWVSRMIMLGLHFTGKEPFHTVYVHALVRDSSGAKMSKSKGNVIDPLELIDQYGADALRFTLSSLAAPGAEIRMDSAKVESYRNFGTKLWNATRFALMSGVARSDNISLHDAKLKVNRWILTETSHVIDQLTSSLVAYRFNEASLLIFRFVRNVFCDWYLEFLKPVFSNPDMEEERIECQACAAFVLDEIFKLLHPFMPFITEELWASSAPSNQSRSSLLCHVPWPKPLFEDAESSNEINWLIELISNIRSVRSEMRVPASAILPFFVFGSNPLTLQRLVDYNSVIQRLARVACFETTDSPVKDSIQIISGEEIFFLSLGDSIDIHEEIERLKNEERKINEEIIIFRKKLSNEGFLRNAPENIVATERERLSRFIEKADQICDALRRIS